MVIFFEFIYKKYIINIMVVKKKRTYKKQKGGLKIPPKIISYFNFVKLIINQYYEQLNINTKLYLVLILLFIQ